MIRKSYISIALLATFLAASLIWFEERALVKGLEEAVYWTLQPVMRNAKKLQGFAAALTSGVSGEEAEALRLENERLKVAVFEREALKEENATLRRALGFKETHDLEMEGARVRLFTKSLGKEFLIIDKGSEQGISEGGIVIDSEGVVVGVVKEAGRTYAKVSVAANPGLSFEVELIPGRAKALAKGIGNRTFSLELIPAGAPLRRGDFAALATSGIPRPFLLGTVASVGARSSAAFQEARAVIIARPESLQNVFIIRK